MSADRSRLQREAAVVAIASQSAMVRVISRAAERFARLYAASRTAARIAALERQWRELACADRLRFAGIVLMVAPAVHIAVALSHQPLPDWRWLVVPGIAAAQGALLFAWGSSKHA
jgi:hypothetical protein